MDIVKTFRDFPVRIVGQHSNPLFVINNIIRILNIKDIGTSLARLEDHTKSRVKLRDSTGHVYTTIAVNKSGLYALILSSECPVSAEFMSWICTEVLPYIAQEHEQSAEKQTNAEVILAENRANLAEEKYKLLESVAHQEYLMPRGVLYIARAGNAPGSNMHKIGTFAAPPDKIREEIRAAFIDLIPVINRERALANLKYIIEQYIYPDLSGEVVQMPYEYLKAAANVALSIDRAKVWLVEKMESRAQTSPIKPFNEEEIENIAAGKVADTIHSPKKEVGSQKNISCLAADEHSPAMFVPSVQNIINDPTTEENICHRDTSLASRGQLYDKFIEENICHSATGFITRGNLRERISTAFTDCISDHTRNIIFRLTLDENASIINGYELIDTLDTDLGFTCIDAAPDPKLSSSEIFNYCRNNFPNKSRTMSKFMDKINSLSFSSHM